LGDIISENQEAPSRKASEDSNLDIKKPNKRKVNADDEEEKVEPT